MAKNPYLDDPELYASEAPAPAPAPAPAAEANPYEAEAASAQPTITREEYETQIRQRMTTKEPVKDIIKWAKSTGWAPDTKELSKAVRGVRTGQWGERSVIFNYPDGKNSKDVLPALKDPEVSSAGSFARQAVNALLLNTGDNIASGMRAVGGEIGEFLGGKEKSFYDRYAEDQQRTAAIERADWDQNPVASGVGMGTGIVGSIFVPMGAVARVGQVAQGASTGARVAGAAKRAGTGAAVGGGMSAVASAGAAAPGQELDNIGTATAIGAGAGAVAEPVVRILGKPLNWAAQRYGLAALWNGLPRDIQAAAQKLKPTARDVERMREAVQVFRRAGKQPRGIDVMDRAERDQVAAMARRPTDAREAAYGAARADSNNLGQNLDRQFGRVTGVEGNAREIGEQIATRRDTVADRAMDQMRHVQLTPETELLDVLSTNVGQRAWRDAMSVERDPAIVQAMEALPGLLQSTAGLGTRARLQALQQTGGITIGMVDRLRKALGDQIGEAQRQGKNALAANLTQMKNSITDMARRGDPNYAKYLQDFSEDSRTLDAIELGGEAFSRNTDEFVEQAQGLSRDRNAVISSRNEREPQGQLAVRENSYAREITPQYGGTRYFDYTLPDGRIIHMDLTVPARGGGEPTAMYNVRLQGHGYGDEEAFHTVGLENIADLQRAVAEHVRREFPWVEGVAGLRVGGIRQQVENRRVAAARAEQEAAEARDRGLADAEAAEDANLAAKARTPEGREAMRREGVQLDNMYETMPERAAQRLRRAWVREGRPGTYEDWLRDRANRTAQGEYDPVFIPARQSDDDISFDDLNLGDDAGDVAPSSENGVDDEWVAQPEPSTPRPGYNSIMEDRSALYEDWLARGHADDLGSFIQREYPHLSEDERTAIVRAINDDLSGNGGIWSDESGAKRIPHWMRRNRMAPGTEAADPIMDDAARFAEVNRRTNGTPTDPSQRRRLTDIIGDERGSVRIPGTGGPTRIPPAARNDPATTDGPYQEFHDRVENTPNAINHGNRVYRENDWRQSEMEEVSGAFYDVTMGDLDFEDLADELSVYPDDLIEDTLAMGMFEDEADIPLIQRYLREVRGYTDDRIPAPNSKELPSTMTAAEKAEMEESMRRLRESMTPEQREQAASGVDDWMRRIIEDESGSLRIRRGRDVPPEPPVANHLPSMRDPNLLDAPIEGNLAGGVRANGNDARNRYPRPANLPNKYGYSSVMPGEVQAPSDQQLAVLAARRAMNAKMGESPRGPHTMGNAMAFAPEQHARNVALMGESVASELQRAVRAEMEAVEASRHVSPGTGSQTALRGQDDQELAEGVQMATNFMGGPKAGMINSVRQFLQARIGMRDQDAEAFVLRALDPTQTDQMIELLAQYLNGDRNTAQQIVLGLVGMTSRVVGTASAPYSPPQE